MGMTYELYWNGDNDLPKLYRKAYDLQRKIKDETCWLQGMYIYEALCDVAPILRSFAKAGTNPKPYPKEPYMLTQEKQHNEETKKEAAYENGKAIIHAWVAKVNKMKGVGKGG